MSKKHVGNPRKSEDPKKSTISDEEILEAIRSLDDVEEVKKALEVQKLVNRMERIVNVSPEPLAVVQVWAATRKTMVADINLPQSFCTRNFVSDKLWYLAGSKGKDGVYKTERRIAWISRGVYWKLSSD